MSEHSRQFLARVNGHERPHRERRGLELRKSAEFLADTYQVRLVHLLLVLARDDVQRKLICAGLIKRTYTPSRKPGKTLIP